MADEDTRNVVITPAGPGGAPVATAPKTLDEAGRLELETRAGKVALQVTSAPEDRQAARRLGSLGQEAQQRAGHEMDLLKTKVGTLLKDVDGEGHGSRRACSSSARRWTRSTRTCSARNPRA